MLSTTEFYYQCERVPLSDFAKHFSLYKREAFRLELLSEYNVPSEAPFIELYKSKKSECPEEFNVGWLNILDNARARGAKNSRLRLIPRGGVSSYMDFEINWGYKRNVQHGENILRVSSEVIETTIYEVPVLMDYWLFDDQDCFLMQYDYVGHFLGVVKLPVSLISSYVSLKNTLVKVATPFFD